MNNIISLSTMKPIGPAPILEVGARIKYTGDMANVSGEGAVVGIGSGYYGTEYDVIFTDGRRMNLDKLAFSRGPGCRFFVIEGKADAEEIAALMANNATVEAKGRADQEARNAMFRAEVDRIKTENASLEQGSGPVVAARNIRKELKAIYPGVKFSVRTSKYSGGNSIDISWTDGPNSAQVDAIIGKYEAGSFNGMEDIYESRSTPWNTVFGSARYVHTSRDYSDSLVASGIDMVARKYGAEPLPVEEYQNGRGWTWNKQGTRLGEELSRTLQKLSRALPANKVA